MEKCFDLWSRTINQSHNNKEKLNLFWMRPLFQLSTRRYKDEIELVKKALADLENLCKVKNGYEIFEPFTKVGWTFFNVQLSVEIVRIIEKTDMMEGALGFRIGEQLKNFLGHFLESKGSQVRIKQIEY